MIGIVCIYFRYNMLWFMILEWLSQKRKDLSSVTILCLLAFHTLCCFALIDLSRENLSWQLHHRLIENRFLKSSSSQQTKIFFGKKNFSLLLSFCHQLEFLKKTTDERLQLGQCCKNTQCYTFTICPKNQLLRKSFKNMNFSCKMCQIFWFFLMFCKSNFESILAWKS